MSEKSEAEVLADALDDPRMVVFFDQRSKAAAELRRLHQENAELRKANDAFGQRQEWWNERMFALEQQRDALLEALDQCLNGTLIGGHTHNDNGLEVLAQRCGAPHVATELRRLAGIARATIRTLGEGK